MIDGDVAGYVVGILDGQSYRVFDGHFETEYSRYSPGRLVEAACSNEQCSILVSPNSIGWPEWRPRRSW